MKNKLLLAGVLLMTLAGSGCVVHERYYGRPAACPGGVWVEGHYGVRGHWHPGHWRCPGVVYPVEVG